MTLAAGDLIRPTMKKMGNAKGVEHRPRPALHLLTREPLQPVMNVVFDREVGKQGEILEDISGVALGYGNINVRCTVEQHVTSHADLSFVRRQQACDALQDRRLPRAGRSKQDGDPRTDFELHVEQESSRAVRRECFLDSELQRIRGSHFEGQAPQTRRFSAYTTDSTAKENTRSSKAVCPAPW